MADEIPNPADVRAGIVYGPGLGLVGTCAVPPATTVVSGVPVDDTVGTAAITPEAVRAAVGLASANLGTQLAAILEDTGTTLPELINALPEAAGTVVFNDLTYGVAITQGTLTAGTPADTLTLGTPLIFTSAGAGIDVDFEFELGNTRVSELTVYAYYTGSGGTPATRAAEVFLWDWLNSTWLAVSDGSNRIPSGAANVVRQYALAPQLQDPVTGLVRVRYASLRLNSGDTLVLDQHSIAAVTTGFTLDEIASAVVNYRVDPDVARDSTHRKVGWLLWQIRPTVGGISSITGNQIVTTGTGNRFFAIDNLYVGHTIQFHEGGTGNYRWAKIIAQTGAVLTVDALPADVVAGTSWHFYILPERAITPNKVTEAITNSLDAYSVATAGQVSAAGFTTTRSNALASIESAVSAIVDGEYRVNYPASTAIQYNADGTPRKTFSLKKADGTLARRPQDAVWRVPQ